MTYYGTVSLFLIGALTWWLTVRGRRHPPLPPGPPADPIIGHLRVIPAKNTHLFFYELSKKYGKIASLHIPGSTIIVLNSLKASIDLLDKRSAIYSDRPQSPVMLLMGWVKNVGFFPYGKEFIKHRRMINDYFHQNVVSNYQGHQVIEARKLIENLTANPDAFEIHLNRYVSATILRIVHGREIHTNDDAYIKLMADASYCVNNCATPGSNSVDLIPALQYFPSWFPGTYPATQARESRPTVDRMYDVPFDDVKRQLKEGIALDSFLATHLEGLQREGENYPYQADDIKGAAATLYFAGADTSWSTLLIFILAMVLHPSAQIQAQAELDRVIGTDNLPDFEDRERLPYIECVVQEAYRWHNAVPAGLPHRSSKDDIYEGMFIPKGSIVVANTRGIALDEEVYQNPHIFDPSRYGRGEPYPIAQFGFGRRICPGRHLGDATIWIAIASILSKFAISPALDEAGREIIPLQEFESGITSRPKRFNCNIRPRGSVTTHEQDI